MITITESAQEYLAELLSKQEDALGVRVFINDPGTPRAETCIAYCREGDVEEGDVEEPFEHFTAWFQGRSIPFLEDALVDYSPDRMGGQLTIKAPNAPKCPACPTIVRSRTALTTFCTTKLTPHWLHTVERSH